MKKKKTKPNFHCQETPLTGKSSSSWESSLGGGSEAHFPPKPCLSEDKFGLGSERECELMTVGPTPMQMRVTKWLLLIFFFVPLMPHGKQEGVQCEPEEGQSFTSSGM